MVMCSWGRSKHTHTHRFLYSYTRNKCPLQSVHRSAIERYWNWYWKFSELSWYSSKEATLLRQENQRGTLTFWEDRCETLLERGTPRVRVKRSALHYLTVSGGVSSGVITCHSFITAFWLNPLQFHFLFWPTVTIFLHRTATAEAPVMQIIYFPWVQ